MSWPGVKKCEALPVADFDTGSSDAWTAVATAIGYAACHSAHFVFASPRANFM